MALVKRGNELARRARISRIVVKAERRETSGPTAAVNRAIKVDWVIGLSMEGERRADCSDGSIVVTVDRALVGFFEHRESGRREFSRNLRRAHAQSIQFASLDRSMATSFLSSRRPAHGIARPASLSARRKRVRPSGKKSDTHAEKPPSPFSPTINRNTRTKRIGKETKQKGTRSA